MGIFLGLIGTAVGCIFVIRTDWLINGFGRVAWAEEKMGPGGSWWFYKILGVIIIFLSFLAITGLMDNFINFVLSPLIRRAQ